jgi:hypothetical protein
VAAALARALARLGVAHGVADDSRYRVWNDYGCKGWPSLFLWGQGGALRWFHFGEGEYQATEAAIGEALAAVDPGFEPPDPVAPLRPSDEQDAMVAPPTEEVFPGGSASEPWRPGAEPVALDYEAGGAHVAIAGSGRLRVALDGGPPRSIDVSAPGLYELAEHPRHERHSLAIDGDGELELYSVGFSAAPP